jgi:hypothetical protein
LDKKRDFLDALGFRDKEYKIYEDKKARDDFNQKITDYDPKIQRRIQRYLENNDNEQKRKNYLEGHSESADEMSADLNKWANLTTQPNSETSKKGNFHEEFYNGQYYLYDEPYPAIFHKLDHSAKSKWHRDHLIHKASDKLAGESERP